MPKRIVVGITGASGAVYGVRALHQLREMPDVETHVVVSPAGLVTLRHETDIGRRELAQLADVTHSDGNVGASIASGSFPVHGMVVAPCSIKTLSAIANSYTADLISRAADVALKEGRPLVLLVRETPLHVGHLRLMQLAAEAGAVIAPPVPAFHAKPTTLIQMVDYTVARALGRLGLPVDDRIPPWEGLPAER